MYGEMRRQSIYPSPREGFFVNPCPNERSQGVRAETILVTPRRTYVMDNLLDFMNMLILWRLGKNCCAGRIFCWHDFAICLQMACEETSLLYNLYRRTVRCVLALNDLKLHPKGTQHTSIR